MEEYNDYELVALAQENSEEAVNILYNKYRSIIVKKSRYAFNFASHHGIDVNDIMQEGFIGFDEAIRSFSQDDGATFYTFALMCIDRQIFNFLRNTTRGKNRILNEAITLDDNLEKVIKDNTDVEFSFFYRDYEKKLIEKTRQELTNFELQVFDLRIIGYTFEEIANTLDRDVKSIYNTFHRIKMKFKKIAEMDN